MKTLLSALLLLLPAIATAQPPAKPPTLAELNKKVVDILRLMHDRGADLYNSGDPSGAVKVYQTALATVTPFIAHHPAILKAVTDGIANADKADGDKAKAFRLHEVIEQVRADLRTEARKMEAAPKPPMPKVAPATIAKLSGLVVLKGKPLAGAEILVATLNLPAPRVFVAKISAEGKYMLEGLPLADYVVIVQGAGVPSKYQTTDTSGLQVTVKVGNTTQDFNLQ